ncbi:MAG: glycosyltransferase [Nitrospirales bacterium]|nr:glycosyltransferase [Nitrospirales bacterium]
MSRSLAVLHITDTLEAGGLERMVVNLANHLPQDRCRTLLCTTRRDGPLLEKLAPHVIRLQLRRRHRFDLQALRSLVEFIREHDIQIIHAHGTSLFVAVVASFFSPFPALVWHIHSGHLSAGGPVTWPYKLVASRIRAVIAVTQDLADWSCEKLHMAYNRVLYVPNFVWRDNEIKKNEKTILPGQDACRIVCLANLHSPKDHATLLHAMALVTRQICNWHLILIGSANDTAYSRNLQKLISNYQLKGHVSFLGHRDDVLRILETCDIGVLSSTSEGFPMTLLEYGMAGLPTVATQVGQCPEILDYGRAGILVPPGSPNQLSEAILELLRSPDRREFLGKQLNLHVQERFNQNRILEKFCLFYEMVVGGQENVAAVPSGR